MEDFCSLEVPLLDSENLYSVILMDFSGVFFFLSSL